MPSLFGEPVSGWATRSAVYATSYAVSGRPLLHRASPRRWNVNVRSSSSISQCVARLGTGLPSGPYVVSPAYSALTSGVDVVLDARAGSRKSGSPWLHHRKCAGSTGRSSLPK